MKYLLNEGDPVIVAVDGTFFSRWGRRVAEARWAYDGSAQGGKKIAFGNTWVIAALVVKLPCCPSPVALPVLFRLWRGKGTPSQVQLAASLLELLVEAFPGREVHGTGDAAFHGESLVIEGATWTTRLPASAVISGPKPPPTGRRGRPEARRPDRHLQGRRRRRGLAGRDRADLRKGAARAGRRLALPVVRSFRAAPGQLVLMREPDSKKPYDLGIFTLDTAWPPKPPSSGTPGGGPSSPPTPPASRSPAPATPATAFRGPSGGPSRSRSSSSP